MRVAARLALRCDGGAVEQHVGVAIAQVHVPVLELRSGGQDVVGVVGRIGLEVFQYHREQVFACKALHHLARVRRHGHGIAVVDHDGLHLRAEGGRGLAQKVVANGGHVDGARCLRGHQVRPLQHRALGRELAGAGQQQAARAVAPRAGEGRQAGHGAHGIAPAAHALHAVVEPDGRGLRGAVVLGQLADLLHRNAADVGRALGRPLQGALAQRFPAQRVAGDVVVVQPVVGDEFVHQRQRQRGIGAGAQLDVLMALVGRLALARVNAYQLGAIALGLLRIAPEVQVAADGIAAPDQDELRLGKELHLHAHFAAQRLHQGFSPGRGADGAVELRCTQLVEETAVHALALHHAHGASVAVGQDGFGRAGRNRLQALRNIGQGFVPADGRELAAALGARALERGEHPLRVVRALGVLADLGAQHAVGVGVGGVALHACGHAVLVHGGQQRAGVGAVVRAGAADLGGLRGRRICSSRRGHGAGCSLNWHSGLERLCISGHPCNDAAYRQRTEAVLDFTRAEISP